MEEKETWNEDYAIYTITAESINTARQTTIMVPAINILAATKHGLDYFNDTESVIQKVEFAGWFVFKPSWVKEHPFAKANEETENQR